MSLHRLFGAKFPLALYGRTPVSPPGTRVERATAHADRMLTRIVRRYGLLNPVVFIWSDREFVWLEVLDSTEVPSDA